MASYRTLNLVQQLLSTQHFVLVRNMWGRSWQGIAQVTQVMHFVSNKFTPSCQNHILVDPELKAYTWNQWFSVIPVFSEVYQGLMSVIFLEII